MNSHPTELRQARYSMTSSRDSARVRVYQCFTLHECTEVKHLGTQLRGSRTSVKRSRGGLELSLKLMLAGGRSRRAERVHWMYAAWLLATHRATSRGRRNRSHRLLDITSVVNTAKTAETSFNKTLERFKGCPRRTKEAPHSTPPKLQTPV